MCIRDSHTCASDGTLDPGQLVACVCEAGVRTFSVTDHDTIAGVPAAAAHARAAGLEFLPGIEITAVWEGRDVHMLGYFLDEDPPGLGAFLTAQRQDRTQRVRKMGSLLAQLGMPIDVERLIEQGSSGRALARPLVARALVAAGHVSTAQEAFDRWIGDSRPAYVARQGASPLEVVQLIRRSGGVAAVAHPGLLRRDQLVAELIAGGLEAIEVFHSDHDQAMQTRYLALARRRGLIVTGGSDFHGPGHHRAAKLGRVGPPRDQFEKLVERIGAVQATVQTDQAPAE